MADFNGDRKPDVALSDYGFGAIRREHPQFVAELHWQVTVIPISELRWLGRLLLLERTA
jgi:hypothetical protein